MPLRRLVAYTGAALVLLAAAASLTRGGPAGEGLSLLLFLNAAAWFLSSLPAAHGTEDTEAPLLAALGDALFPLTLLGAFRALAPGLEALPPVAAVAALLGGAAFRLRARRPRADAFYPWFLAGSAAVLGAVLQVTGFLSGEDYPWFVAALGFSLAILFARAAPELSPRFSKAGLALVYLGAAADARAFRQHPSIRLVLVPCALAVVLLAVAALRRRDEPASRSFAFAGLAALTLALAEGAALAPGASPDPVVSGWALALVLASIPLSAGPAAWAAEEARRVAGLAGVASAVALASRAWPVASGSSREDAASLLVVALALGIGSALSRRRPAITATLAGFIARSALVEVASVAAPLLLVAAAGGLLPGAVERSAACLALGGALLALSDRAPYFYPAAPLRIAGYAATLAPLPALFGTTTGLVACVLVSAGVFLWRSAREPSPVPHALLLASLAAATWLIADRFAGGPAPLALAILSVAAMGARVAFPPSPGGEARASSLLALSLAVGGVALVVDLRDAGASPSTPFVLWLGTIVLVATARRFPVRTDTPALVGRPLETIALLLVQVAGVLGVVALFAARSLPLGAAGPAVALLAIVQVSAAHALHGRPHVRTIERCGRAIATASLALPFLFPTGPGATVATLLLVAIFCVVVEREVPRRAQAAGLALACVAAALALGGPGTLPLAGLAGGGLVFAWHSVRTGSLPAHVGSLALATFAVALLSPLVGGSLETGLSAAAVLAVFVAAVVVFREGRGPRARLSTAWGLLVGAAVVVAAAPAIAGAAAGHAAGGTWLALVPAWVAFLAAARFWRERGDPDLRPDEPEDAWIAVACAGVAHAAGGVALAVFAASWQRALGAAALGFAVCAWVYVGWRRRASEATSRAALLGAVNGFGCAALLLAAWAQGDGLVPVAAAGAVAALFASGTVGTFRRALAAPAAIEALWLLGVSLRIDFVEYFVAPVGVYLCFLLAWGALSRSRAVASLLAAGAVIALAFVPLDQLLRGGGRAHLLVLGGGAAALVRLAARAPALRGRFAVAVAACGSFAAGSLFVALTEPADWVTLFFAGAGFVALGSAAWGRFAATGRAWFPTRLRGSSSRAPSLRDEPSARGSSAA